MQNCSKTGSSRRLGSLLLALAVLLSFLGTFNVTPLCAAAAGGPDVAVTGFYVQGAQVRVTLYDVGGTRPGTVGVIVYQDGSRIYTQDQAVSWNKNTASLEFSVGKELKQCDLTVVVRAPGDRNRSNDNLSITVGQSSAFPTEPPVTEPTQAPTEAPTVPTEPQVTVRKVTAAAQAGATSVTLTWSLDAHSGNTDPQRYEITLNGQTYTATGVGSHTFSGLASGQTYSYTVKAYYQGAETSSASGTVTTQSWTPTGDAWDLIVTELTWEPREPQAGDKVVFTATIQNVGRTASPSGEKHGVLFTVNGGNNTWNDQFYGPLAPGESVTLTATGGASSNGWTAAAGTYTVTARVNDDNSPKNESNRDNNTRSRTLTVASVSLVNPPTEGMPSGENVNVAPMDSYGGRRNDQVAVVINGKQSPSISAKVNTHRYYNQCYGYETVPVNIFELKDGAEAMVRVGLPTNVKLESVVVRPLSANVKPRIVTLSGGQKYVEFPITKQGSYVVEYNGSTTGALHLFANPVYTSGQYGGDYLPLGSMRVADGFGGLSVYGSGVLVQTVGGNAHAAVNAGSGAGFRGVTLINESEQIYGDGAGIWNVEVRDASNVTFDYFHILAGGANSDGISIQSSDHVTVTNSFIRTWDDGVVLKNYSWGRYTHDVTVQNCVFWTDLAQAMELGAETNKAVGPNPTIYGVTFENIDVVHACHKPAMSIHNMDNASIYDVTWRNVTVEDASMGYNTGVEDGWPILIDLTNVIGGELDGTTSAWTHEPSRGSIDNVTFENIRVLGWKNTAGKIPGIRMANSSQNGGGSIRNIKINGLYYRNADGSTRTIGSLTDLNALCNWNPKESANPQGVRADYGVITFGTAGTPALPDPSGSNGSRTVWAAERLGERLRKILSEARNIPG